MQGLTFWLLYFTPTLIGWFRARQGKAQVYSTWQLFLFNLMLGWTVVGWFLMLANALGFNTVAWIAPRLVKVLPTGQPGTVAQNPQSSFSGTACAQCQGSGSMMCSSCMGRGSWYDPAHGENGVAQRSTCHACTSSGRLRCGYCSGTGRSAALI